MASDVQRIIEELRATQPERNVRIAEHRARQVHKARPDDPDSDAEQPCAVCHWRVKKVPGGQGPTWIHVETGAVAAPGGES